MKIKDQRAFKHFHFEMMAMRKYVTVKMFKAFRHEIPFNSSH